MQTSEDKSRPANIDVECFCSWWRKYFVLIKKYSLHLVLGVVLLAFFVGGTVALTWTFLTINHSTAYAAKGGGKPGGGKPKAQCNDQEDNDGDGFCDFLSKKTRCRDGSEPGDPDCISKDDNSEAPDCTEGQTKSCGSDIGECQSGIQTCSSGAWGSCIGEVGPITEVCDNNLDDDCDGQIDEDCQGGSAFWTTSFDCGNYNFCDQNNRSPSCMNGSQILFDMCRQPSGCADTTEALISENYSQGGGGSAVVLYYCPVPDGHTAYIGIDTSAQRKLWVRWYAKVPSGNNYPSMSKFIYLLDAASNSGKMAIKMDVSNGKVRAEAGGGGFSIDFNWRTGIYDFANIYGGYDWDNNFHSYEVYADKGTNENNGILRYWIDGHLVAEWTEVDMNGNTEPNWNLVQIPSNLAQRTPDASFLIAYDDIAIAEESYNDFITDSNGYPMIGPINGSESSGNILIVNKAVLP